MKTKEKIIKEFHHLRIVKFILEELQDILKKMN